MLRDIFGTHFAPSRNAEMHLRGDYMLSILVAENSNCRLPTDMKIAVCRRQLMTAKRQ